MPIAARFASQAVMTETVTRPRWLWISILLGSYAASLALLRDPVILLLALAPVLLIAIAWWTLSGAPDRWVAVFLCVAALTPPLPIALGDSGPHPSLLIAAIGLAAGLIRLSDWRIPSDGLSRAIVVLFFVLLLSAGLAAFYSGAAIALGTMARVLLLGISVFVFFYVTCGPFGVFHPMRTAGILFLAGAGSAAFACVDFYYQFPAPAGFEQQFVWLDSGVYRRAQGLFYEASTLGNFCAFFLVMAAVALTRPKKDFPLPRPVLLAGAAVFSAALVLSYSRASLVNVLIAGATLLWLRRGSFRIGRILSAIAVGSAAAYYFLPTFLQHYWDRLSGSAQYLFTGTEGVLSGRLSSWSAIANFLRENPFYALLGIGYKTLPYTNFIGHTVVGDNMYLTLLIETGVVGLSAFLFLNFAILKSAYRAARNASPAASFLGSWMFCFWMGEMFQMMSGDLFTYWRVLPFYFWALAAAVRATDEHPVS
jgi:O-antigen ligase